MIYCHRIQFILHTQHPPEFDALGDCLVGLYSFAVSYIYEFYFIDNYNVIFLMYSIHE